ncbi:hypothetical protein QNI19_35495 [Cytophagaceae bacterium DM2B3-1]|uniref:Uncharacterized protein n=1 Tax=Xanthocytophaga flava TaxID=3048013 RepID=A0ABT7D0I0_9BACT|nr:hypothetical protein [Xanthocytophaga flavus]MDJ1498294.1 hypothetical protein [Xanthocytophaga flavus]
MKIQVTILFAVSFLLPELSIPFLPADFALIAEFFVHCHKQEPVLSRPVYVLTEDH